MVLFVDIGYSELVVAHCEGNVFELHQLSGMIQGDAPGETTHRRRKLMAFDYLAYTLRDMNRNLKWGLKWGLKSQLFEMLRLNCELLRGCLLVHELLRQIVPGGEAFGPHLLYETEAGLLRSHPGG